MVNRGLHPHPSQSTSEQYYEATYPVNPRTTECSNNSSTHLSKAQVLKMQHPLHSAIGPLLAQPRVRNRDAIMRDPDLLACMTHQPINRQAGTTANWNGIIPYAPSRTGGNAQRTNSHPRQPVGKYGS